MGISDYGLWKCTPTSWNGTADTDHGHLEFTDADKGTYEADVNIMSSDTDKRLVYWFVSNFDAKQPSTTSLSQLSEGFSTQKGSSSLALDFLREGFLDPSAGTLVSHDPKDPTEKGDILSYLDPIMNQAVQEKATMYLWGSHYQDSSTSQGIHDIHMNQGNAGSFEDENGTYQDGGIVIQFANGTWQGIFLAFATQTLKTDDKGDPEGETFAQALGGGSTSTTSTSEARTSHPTKGQVGIEAAIVNPRGPDRDAPEGKRETVYIQNKSNTTQSLEGWTIENKNGEAEKLGSGVQLAAHTKKGFEVPEAPLSNSGGKIVLKDAKGTTVSEVSYTEKEARKEGRLLYFAN
ncbi:hypothetical protein M406DRAFT_323138 [Cryphonectria parasitica EP155]|uniref:LTD domain-containing protein n=1 Tax=Cryphonectria parasitica (strain ATCC 38755 / EP155) TaxID=660469 RepID=A0A9P4XYK2_CRYP1|nr:uncharacterized protein M406DRAFT_323138 [Cryphonectria parasitica EP155]KAF3763378.1 hypothetical protein M406DRAFT_323138 [Cryphonectria parasitica EP155]